MASDQSSGRPPWMPPADPDEPQWNQDDADWLVGKYVLVGVRYFASDGITELRLAQCHGRIVAADESGIEIACEGLKRGEKMWLPPHLPAFTLADPGNYELRSTGEIIKDPDVLTTWDIMHDQESSKT